MRNNFSLCIRYQSWLERVGFFHSLFNNLIDIFWNGKNEKKGRSKIWKSWGILFYFLYNWFYVIRLKMRREGENQCNTIIKYNYYYMYTYVYILIDLKGSIRSKLDDVDKCSLQRYGIKTMCLKCILQTSLSTVEIKISFPPWIHVHSRIFFSVYIPHIP